jgi:hypothetical protein
MPGGVVGEGAVDAAGDHVRQRFPAAAVGHRRHPHPRHRAIVADAMCAEELPWL